MEIYISMLLLKFLRKWGWFHGGHNVHFLKYLGQKIKILKKLRHSLVNERAMKKKLSQNRTEKQIISFKAAVNWVFNDKWHYSVIGCYSTSNCKGLLYS